MGRTSWPTLRKGGVRGERYLWLASWAALLKSIPSLPGQPCKSHFWFPLAVARPGERLSVRLKTRCPSMGPGARPLELTSSLSPSAPTGGGFLRGRSLLAPSLGGWPTTLGRRLVWSPASSGNACQSPCGGRMRRFFCIVLPGLTMRLRTCRTTPMPTPTAELVVFVVSLASCGGLLLGGVVRVAWGGSVAPACCAVGSSPPSLFPAAFLDGSSRWLRAPCLPWLVCRLFGWPLPRPLLGGSPAGGLVFCRGGRWCGCRLWVAPRPCGALRAFSPGVVLFLCVLVAVLCFCWFWPPSFGSRLRCVLCLLCAFAFFAAIGDVERRTDLRLDLSVRFLYRTRPDMRPFRCV